MRRATTLLSFAASMLLAATAHAGPHGKHGHKGKDHHGGGGGGGSSGTVVLSGAGQRLHYSFGGRIVLDKKMKEAHGLFSVVVHPLAPTGDTLNATCRYKHFKNLTVSGNTLEVDARGKCTILHTDGAIEIRDADNHLTIVDDPAGTDSIDMEVNGSTGISIPGGALSFGDFGVTSTGT